MTNRSQRCERVEEVVDVADAAADELVLNRLQAGELRRRRARADQQIEAAAERGDVGTAIRTARLYRAVRTAAHMHRDVGYRARRCAGIDEILVERLSRSRRALAAARAPNRAGRFTGARGELIVVGILADVRRFQRSAVDVVTRLVPPTPVTSVSLAAQLTPRVAIAPVVSVHPSAPLSPEELHERDALRITLPIDVVELCLANT